MTTLRWLAVLRFVILLRLLTDVDGIVLRNSENNFSIQHQQQPRRKHALPRSDLVVTCRNYIGGSNDRRHMLFQSAMAAFSSSLMLLFSSCATRAAIAAPVRNVQVTINQPGTTLGVVLYDVTIGTPPRTVVAIQRVVSANSPVKSRQSLQAGMILRDYSSAAQVVQRLQQGPFPVTLVFENLAAAGDAISDSETPLVSAQDALQLAQKQTDAGSIAAADDVSKNTNNFVYRKTVLQQTNCNIQSRRNDVLEIHYEARLGGTDGIVYDSSYTRGTGQPYQMVLGSGDMLSGVDLGLYDMCPGEVRALQIPPALAYGQKGNKLFRIPPNTALSWRVELISINGVRQGDQRTRQEMEERE